MKYQEYLAICKALESKYEGAVITIPALGTHNAARLLHVALGLSTEALELLGAIREDKPRIDQFMELSDLAWFSAVGCDECGIVISDDTLKNNEYPATGAAKVADLCETFATRIKAALCYGTPVKPGDEYPDAWKNLLPEIFYRASAIYDKTAGRPGALMELNIRKLKARYPDGRFDAICAHIRNEMAEKEAAAAKPVDQKKLEAEIAKIKAEAAKPAPTVTQPDQFRRPLLDQAAASLRSRPVPSAAVLRAQRSTQTPAE